MAIVENLHPGKDKVIRATGSRTAKNYLEGPIQLLYTIRLYCNTVRKIETKLNLNVEQFRPSRPKQTIAAVAKVKFKTFQKKMMTFFITHQMGGVLCSNSRDLVTILSCGCEKMLDIL